LVGPEPKTVSRQHRFHVSCGLERERERKREKFFVNQIDD